MEQEVQVGRGLVGLVSHGEEVDHVLLRVALLLEDHVAERLLAQVAQVGVQMRDHEQHVAAAQVAPGLLAAQKAGLRLPGPPRPIRIQTPQP